VTTTIVIHAHPVAPNNVVEATVYDPDSDGAETIIEASATYSCYIHDQQTLSIREAARTIVRAPAPDVQ
jgi:cyclopropane fatty-acyl-phospholipid synthase-like methyltransferase